MTALQLLFDLTFLITTVESFELIIYTQSGHWYIHFWVIFLAISGGLTLISGIFIISAVVARRLMIKNLGDDIQYSLLDFENVGADWVDLQKPVDKHKETSKEKSSEKKGLLAAKEKFLKEKAEKSASSRKSGKSSKSANE
ncbi:unnamed protein product [Caenorhabditis auriculariae]|uniref:Nematode cuticle collagen N-terminal domain-containing protein n=1 Tax=Caenorhabditis auriculariae TaxID=2777116 RepID=A0A8S1H8Z6_9PELO|nr:unnamed protein product [Caenorhabditis auriculariae]